MAKGADAGKAFLAGVLAKLSPEDRQQGEEILARLSTLGGGVIVTAVGDGTLATADFTRQSNELQVKATELEAKAQEIADQKAQLDGVHTAQTEWWERNNAALTEYNRLKKDGKLNPNPNPNPNPGPGEKGVMTTEQYDEAIANERMAYLGFTRDHNLITRQHFERFKEIPDLDGLLKHPEIGKIGLIGVYELVHKDRLAKFAEDAKKAEEERIRLDERIKVQNASAQMPFPPVTGVGSGSPLDALTAKQDTVADAATAHYNRIQQERAAGHPNPS